MPAAKDPTDRILGEITLGRCDHRMSEIIDAATGRILGDKARVSWYIDVDGINVCEEDLTLDESVAIERKLGLAWANMGPAAAAEHARTIIVELYQTRLGLTAEDAEARAGKLTRRQWNDGIGTYDADPSEAVPS